MQPILMVTMIWTGFGIVHMVAIANPPVSYNYYAGLILVFIYWYTFIRIRFVWATIAGWVIVAFYEVVAVFINQIPGPVLLNNNFFFISANIIGMFACYSFESYARKDFYLARLLEQEKEKVNAVNFELEQRVRERTAQLFKANIDLKQEMAEHERAERELIQAHKMEAIGTLAGGIAHDFNNILMAIMGYAEIGLYKKNISTEKTSYIFQQIMQAGGRAKSLVKQILTFSRQQEQEKMPVHVGSIVKEALKLLAVTLPKNIEISRHILTEADLVLADPIQIHQIIMNLCTNAAHAMKETGGDLRVALLDVQKSTPEAIIVSDLSAEAFIELSVRDTGTGIDASIVDRIFDPFFSTKAKGEGTGMGLSVVHGIVKSCGGKVVVESYPNNGACFRVFLPKIDRLFTEAAQDMPSLPAGTEHIFFVDDEPALIEVVKEMLETFGYAVTTSSDPAEALERFRENPRQFDLVITDKNMPRMSGFELAKGLLSIYPGIPLILCSGFNDHADMEKAEAIGFSEMIIKPLVMREVAETIRQVLDRKQAQ